MKYTHHLKRILNIHLRICPKYILPSYDFCLLTKYNKHFHWIQWLTWEEAFYRTEYHWKLPVWVILTFRSWEKSLTFEELTLIECLEGCFMEFSKNQHQTPLWFLFSSMGTYFCIWEDNTIMSTPLVIALIWILKPCFKACLPCFRDF